MTYGRGAIVMDKSPTLGQVIRTRRLSLGLTQEELAARIGDGVRQAEVSRLECDRVTLPRRRRLERIAAALEIPLGQLLANAGWSGADGAFGAIASNDEDEEAPVSTVASEPVVVTAPADDWSHRPRQSLGTDQLREALEQAQAILGRTEQLLQSSSALVAASGTGAMRPQHQER
jgi:transcriptional regulator with XRE-family HTH domain